MAFSSTSSLPVLHRLRSASVPVSYEDSFPSCPGQGQTGLIDMFRKGLALKTDHSRSLLGKALVKALVADVSSTGSRRQRVGLRCRCSATSPGSFGPQQGNVSTGASPDPENDNDVESAERQKIFNRIAPVYDQLNDWLSLGQHHSWKKMTVKWSRASRGHSALDICCGSGDLAFLLADAVGPHGLVVGLDFAAEQLAVASQRAEESALHSRLRWVQGDALMLPFGDEEFDAVTMGYGLRNVTDLSRSLREIHRVLKKGCSAAILDFNNSTNVLTNSVQGFMLDRVVVPVASQFGLEEEYKYLRPSIERFPTGDKLVKLGRESGFASAAFYEIGFGFMGVLGTPLPDDATFPATSAPPSSRKSGRGQKTNPDKQASSDLAAGEGGSDDDTEGGKQQKKNWSLEERVALTRYMREDCTMMVATLPRQKHQRRSLRNACVARRMKVDGYPRSAEEVRKKGLISGSDVNVRNLALVVAHHLCDNGEWSCAIVVALCTLAMSQQHTARLWTRPSLCETEFLGVDLDRRISSHGTVVPGTSATTKTVQRRRLFPCKAQTQAQDKKISDSPPKTGERKAVGMKEVKDQGRVAKVPVSRIRNFSIIAHIDHGKSTLADRLLQQTGTVEQREMKEQFLDNMDLERERGITIKLQAARMQYVAKDGEVYCLNLIDTPGHVDFSYEVSRSLAACEGALLVVDASQGVEAQTLANVYLALENNLEIIPVLNKIDLPGADPDRVREEIEEMIGLDCREAILCSAKEGIGVDEILEAVVKKVPAPPETVDEPLRALIFDSYYDSYRGVIVYFRIIDGDVRKGDKILFMASGKEYVIDELGVLSPSQIPVDRLRAGEVGYIAASIRSVADARVGDTITHAGRKAAKMLPGYEEATPMVFCGLFPIDADQFPELREALEKLQLNDAALKFEPETSSAMGFGFRCGFLGLLHMEIVQERLEREYNLNLITTAPSVVYRVHTTSGDVIEVDNPAALPDAGKRQFIEEPYVRLEVITPKDYIGTLMELAQNRRGDFKELKYITTSRASIVYEVPLGEVVSDFFDQMKSRSKGYASMEYSMVGYRKNDLVKLDISINGDSVDPLATIVHRDKAYNVGRALTQKLKELIPRQMFKIPIQACIGTKVIASESISAMRKDVLAKCYGGDITRKKKLLKKQAEGKKRMKSVGRVDVPQDAFMAVLKLEKEVT
ncbi:hypothetical protein CBR_g41196 [Chara braunii]|uniref:Multifunctional fusion protein n=1 Tax=Chara braunii TaxID=69332 RepID=A0A388K2K2_CHABU|nr:hypothetical protein CBR_g41196 [Chara braunii]|eukprot:GBG64276.1 hypothetical protein CBR_g41196 [Chara braunii]